MLQGKKNGDRTSNIAHSKLARSHLSISFFFSYRFKCSWHKKSKVEYRISNNIAVTTRGEEPHIAARCCRLCIAVSVVASAARRPPHAPAPCHPARRPARRPPHATRRAARCHRHTACQPIRRTPYIKQRCKDALGCRGCFYSLVMAAEEFNGTTTVSYPTAKSYEFRVQVA